jgi:hypothetical protein
MKGFVKAIGDAESKSILFKPISQDGDSKNKTSQLMGKLPQAMVGRQIDLTIPNIRISVTGRKINSGAAWKILPRLQREI